MQITISLATSITKRDRDLNLQTIHAYLWKYENLCNRVGEAEFTS